MKPFRPAYWLSAAERLADIERGLQRLASKDRELASVIVGVYFRLDLLGLAKKARLVLLGDRARREASTARRRLDQAERRLLERRNGLGEA